MRDSKEAMPPYHLRSDNRHLSLQCMYHNKNSLSIDLPYLISKFYKENDIYEIEVPCIEIAFYMRGIFDCCRGGPAISGHNYLHPRLYSIWAGFGHCNRPSNERPSIYPYLPYGGVNGICQSPY